MSITGSHKERSGAGTRKIWHDRQVVACLLASAAALLVLSWPMLLASVDDLRLVGTFNTDERLHVELVQSAVERTSLDLRFPNYGHLHFHLALIPLLVLRPFVEADVATVLLLLRLQSLLFGALCLTLTFVLARAVTGGIGGVVAWALVFSSRSFLELSWVSHPDLPAMFFVACSLAALHRLTPERTLKPLIAASAAAGLAFAAKYTGIFLLPLIILLAALRVSPEAEWVRAVLRRLPLLLALAGLFVVAAALLAGPGRLAPWLTADGSLSPEAQRALGLLRWTGGIGGALLVGTALWTKARRPQLPQWLVSLLAPLVVAGISFTAAFTVGSPGSWLRLSFLRGLLVEGSHVGGGSVLFRWLATFAGPWALGAVGCVLLLLALPHALARSGDHERRLRPEHIHLIWVAGFFGFVAVTVDLVAARYLLPLLPSAALVASLALRWRQPLPAVGLVALGLLAVGQFWGHPGWVAEHRTAAQTRSSTDAATAGRWLAETVAPSSVIYQDEYCYVPEVFARVTRTWGGTGEELARVQPDVVCVSDKIAERHLGKGGPSDAYYEGLGAADSSFELLRDFGDVALYARRERR